VAASDYIDAAQKYVASYSGDAPSSGMAANRRAKQVGVNGVSPGHRETVTVAQKLGRLVRCLTKEYSSPDAVVIIASTNGCGRTLDRQGLIQAIRDGSDL